MKLARSLLVAVCCLSLAVVLLGPSVDAQPATPVASIVGTPTASCADTQPAANAPTAPKQPLVASPPLLHAGELVMATNATLPPLQYVDSSGKLQGMRIDLGNEIARRLGLKPVWVNIEFDAMIPGLQGDRWDMINTGLYYTTARAKIMELVPYEVQAISISVAKGNPEKIATTKDLAGKKVGVEIGGYEEATIRQINAQQVAAGLKSMDIRTFNTFADAYQALAAGQVDATVSVDAVAKYYQEKGSFDRAISGLAGAPAALAFKSHDLAVAVARVLNAMKADGSYQALFNKYGVSQVNTPCFEVF